jgi:hypothetical protein
MHADYESEARAPHLDPWLSEIRVHPRSSAFDFFVIGGYRRRSGTTWSTPDISRQCAGNVHT